MLKFTVVLIPEEKGGYSVEVPDLPGCLTQGETREEAIGLYLESLVADGEPVPQEDGLETMVSLPALEQSEGSNHHPELSLP